jgi:plasmid stability protein
MAQLLVRNLDGQLFTTLQRRSEQNGRSMEKEVRNILVSALRDEETPAVGLGSEIAAPFRNNGLQEEIPELRGHVL